MDREDPEGDDFRFPAAFDLKKDSEPNTRLPPTKKLKVEAASFASQAEKEESNSTNFEDKEQTSRQDLDLKEEQTLRQDLDLKEKEERDDELTRDEEFDFKVISKPNFEELAQFDPRLKPFLIRKKGAKNESSSSSINFHDVGAVHQLTKTILWHDFGLQVDFPSGTTFDKISIFRLEGLNLLFISLR